MKKKLLVFLGIFIFMIIPKNVYASQVFPHDVKLNNTYIVNYFAPTGNTFYVNTSSTQSATVGFTVSSYSNESLTSDASFSTYPYILVYFQTWNTESELMITKNTSCTTSCFSSQNVSIKYIGTNALNGKYQYVMILQAKKWSIIEGSLGGSETLYRIEDSFTFQSPSTALRNYEFLNVVLSDTNNISAVDNFSSVVNNATTNTNNIISSAQQNTQNIINNQNYNQQQTNEKLDELNDTMKSEEAPTTNDVSDKTSEWSSKLAGTGPVSQMVLMPITLLNGYVSGMNATCQPYNLGNLMGTDIVLPCINVSNYLGATLWNVIDILFSGFMIYAIGKKFVKIFNDFTNLRDNQIDDLYGGGK